MFEWKQQDYPKTWKEYSWEYRMLFIFHVCIMFLFMLGQELTIQQELSLALALLGTMAVISIYHRATRRWRWPGVRAKDIVWSVLSIAMTAFFLYAATPLFPPTNPRHFPWYMGGFVIGLWGVLNILRIVYLAEAAFLERCHRVDEYGRTIEPGPPTEPAVMSEPGWKRAARGGFTIVFMLVWIAGVAAFYVFGSAYKNGSPEPTVTHTEPLNQQGKIRYVTAAQKKQVDVLHAIMWAGIPCVLLIGAVLHFGLGVKLFPDGSGSGKAAMPGSP